MRLLIPRPNTTAPTATPATTPVDIPADCACIVVVDGDVDVATLGLLRFHPLICMPTIAAALVRDVDVNE